MRIYIGWDPHEMMAWNIAQTSMQQHAPQYLDIRRLAMEELSAKNLYTRPTIVVDGRLHDVVSDAPMSTGHAIARFFVPMLEGYTGWAAFVDGDILVRRDINELFDLRDDRYAVMCVQHPSEWSSASSPAVKKDGAPQTYYARKNWSSVMLFNCGHAANTSLNLHALNTQAGRDLQRFCWLADHEIGALPPTWNHLVGISPLDPDPAIAHFTLGTPQLPHAVPSPFDSEWINHGVHCGYRSLLALLNSKVTFT